MTEDNITWTQLPNGETIETVVFYGVIQKRDWRWLWLKRREESVLLGYLPTDDRTPQDA